MWLNLSWGFGVARKANVVSYLISLMCHYEWTCATTSSFHNGTPTAHAQILQYFSSDILPAVLCLMGEKCWSSAPNSYLSRDRGVYQSDQELLIAMWRHITAGLCWAESLKLSFRAFRKRVRYWIPFSGTGYSDCLGAFAITKTEHKLSNVCPPIYLSAPNNAIHNTRINVRTYNGIFINICRHFSLGIKIRQGNTCFDAHLRTFLWLVGEMYIVFSVRKE